MTDLNDLFKVIAEGKKHYEETDPVGKKLKEVKDNAKVDLSALFEQLTSLKEDLEKELVVAEAKQEQAPMITEEIPAQPIIHTPEVRAAQVDADVNKYLTDKSFQNPQPDIVNKDVEAIRNKIKFLEQAIGRIAAAGPGGGEVNLRWLDDVDRSTITDGWYLRYSESKKKFEFAEVQASGGNGATGATGLTGATGPQGATGIGIDGATGPQGEAGASGADSTVPGATGEQGASGVQGETGATGIDGASGVSGLDGATGIQGASGSTGLTGATGLQGDRYQTTSNTTQTIVNSGQLTFYTNDLGLAYSAEQTVIVVANDGHHMHGTVVSYDKITGALVLDINSRQGSGTYSFWTINLDGAVGAIGASGINGSTGATGIQGASGIGATGLTGATGPQGNPGSGGAIANYGSFYDLTDQIASLTDTAYPIPLGYTAEAVGTSIVDGTKVKVDYEGVYNIQFSIQLHNRGGAGSGTTIQIWLRKNGVDVVDSATKVDVDTNSPWSVAAWNFMLSMNANDYIQLMWSTNTTAIAIEYNTAVAPAPAIPSTILTIQQVMYTQVGATGYTGATGVQGIQGASGATGTQGASGVNGASGTIGINGASGIQGASGSTGLTGATGPTGATGIQGASGPNVSIPAWTSGGAITIGGTTTAPTKGVTSKDNISYRQVGAKEWEVVLSYTQTSTTGSAAGSGDYLFTLPNSLSFDTTLASQPQYQASINTSTWVLIGYTIPSSAGAIAGDVNTGGRAYAIIYSATQFRILTVNDANWIKCMGSTHWQINGWNLILQLTFRFTST